MLEKEVESYLVNRVKAAGGKAYKWVSPGNAGVPDRIILMPGGVIAFVELKHPGGIARALQKVKIRDLAALGFTVCIIDNKGDADALVCYLRERGKKKDAVCTSQLPGLLHTEDT